MPITRLTPSGLPGRPEGSFDHTRDLTLTASTGSFVLSGQSTLRSVPPYTHLIPSGLPGRKYGSFVKAAPGAYTLTASTGVFALSGQVALLQAARLLSCATGTFSLSGQISEFLITHIIPAASGNLVVSGQVAGLLVGRVLQASTGTFQETGQDVVFRRTYVLGAGTGVFDLSGQQVTLRSSHFNVDGSIFTLTGSDAQLVRTSFGTGAGISPPIPRKRPLSRVRVVGELRQRWEYVSEGRGIVGCNTPTRFQSREDLSVIELRDGLWILTRQGIPLQIIDPPVPLQAHYVSSTGGVFTGRSINRLGVRLYARYFSSLHMILTGKIHSEYQDPLVKLAFEEDEMLLEL